MDAVSDVQRTYAPEPGSSIDAQLDAWREALMGAKLAAAFAFVIVIAFTLGTLVLLLTSFKSLGHPGRRFGRGWVIA